MSSSLPLSLPIIIIAAAVVLNFESEDKISWQFIKKQKIQEMGLKGNVIDSLATAPVKCAREISLYTCAPASVAEVHSRDFRFMKFFVISVQ